MCAASTGAAVQRRNCRRGIFTRDLNNFGPRVGVVYSATDTTVIRTGFGVYYDNLNLNGNYSTLLTISGAMLSRSQGSAVAVAVPSGPGWEATASLHT